MFKAVLFIVFTMSVSPAHAQTTLPELRLRGGIVSADNTGASCGSHTTWRLGADARTRGQWFVSVSGDVIGSARSICTLPLVVVTYKGVEAGRFNEGGLDYDHAVLVSAAFGVKVSRRLELSAGPGLLRASSIRGDFHPVAFAASAVSLGSRVSAHLNIGAVRSPTRERFVSRSNNVEVGVENHTKWPALLTAGIAIQVN